MSSAISQKKSISLLNECLHFMSYITIKHNQKNQKKYRSLFAITLHRKNFNYRNKIEFSVPACNCITLLHHENLHYKYCKTSSMRCDCHPWFTQLYSMLFITLGVMFKVIQLLPKIIYFFCTLRSFYFILTTLRLFTLKV